MIGLYIHIPYCIQKCAYCDFTSFALGNAGSGVPQSYLDALIREMDLWADKNHEPVATVFIGGGTPSLMSSAQLQNLLDAVRARFDCSATREVTMEMNPGTVSHASLEGYRRAGVNRVSLGVQATQARLLHEIGRIHTAGQAEQAVRWARAAGFDSVNLDLMMGLPGQTLSDWSQALDWAMAQQPEHISCYGLQVEEGTLLHTRLEHHRIVLPGEDDERAMYDLALALLPARGYVHYEISNFALAGYACKHNLTYWRNGQYIGLGVAAHSCMEDKRYANEQDLEAYVARVESQTLPPAQYIPPREQMFETVMLGLRLIEGLDLAAYQARYGEPFERRFGPAADRQIAQGLLCREGHFLRLTRKGMDIQNSVLVALMP